MHFINISRDSNKLLFSIYFRNLPKVFTIEQKMSQESERKNKQFTKNGKKNHNKL